jgi:imidazoleglycerol-phosphate dehydratase
MNDRKAKVTRSTKETSIKIDLNIDGTGQTEISTGILFFDHMLDQLARHGALDLKLAATGPDQHHVVEDIGICLGRAFDKALGNREGIARMAHAIVPMDESLAMVAIDISGRGYTVIEAQFNNHAISGMPSDLIRHFLISFAAESRINIHVKVFSGINDHHKAEAIFKAMAKSLDAASRIDERIAGIPSTKDVID